MWHLLLFSITVYSVSFSPELPHYSIVVILFVTLLLCCYWRCFLLACVIAGLCVGFLQGHYLLANQLPSNIEGNLVQVIGVVTGLPSASEDKQRFLFSVKQLVVENKNVNISFSHRIIQLSWYQHLARQSSTAMVYPSVKTGQQWQFSVKLRRPRGFVNPAGFDYQAYLLRKNISATGYVLDKYPPLLMNDSCWHVWVDCLRWQIQQRFRQLSSDPTTLAPLMALVVGDTQWLTQEQWHTFKQTGTIHLLAISGLHIGLAATIGFWLGRVLLCAVGIVFPFVVANYVVPRLSSIFFAGLYSLLAGMSLPTQRALVMVLVFHLAGMLYYRVGPVLLLASALFVLCFLDPLAMHSQGFWLSFLAVIVLLYGFLGRNTQPSNRLVNHSVTLIKAQWILAVGLLLPNLIWLQGLSLSAPVANLFAISWVSITIVPLLFLLLFLLVMPSSLASTLAHVVYAWLELSMNLLLQVLQWFEQTGLGFWTPFLVEPSLLAIVLAVLAVSYLLLPLGISYRHYHYLACFGFLPLLFPPHQLAPLAIMFMDVGQGTAIVVETKNHHLVYDTGRWFSERFNAGEHLIAPYLRASGVSQLDKLIVSHGDADHAGGAKGLLSIISAKQILSGQPEAINTGQSTVGVGQCYGGQQWVWDEVEFRILWPPLDKLEGLSDNNRSCVLLISYQGKHVLLTGDIEKPVEQQLLSDPEFLHAVKAVDIALVPHHGSKTSSSAQWVKHVQPYWAIVTAAYKNQYHHPHPSIEARYQRAGSMLLNTASSGAVRWHVDRQGRWQLERWRLHHRRYWYK
ncbi:MAG: competence protein ComEC [Kiritimatiellia bacterium]|jgi:competence protein ComEC